MQSSFPLSALVESVRRLIVSHGIHDDVAFRHSAEALVRELSVTNRPSEAKALRDALGHLSVNGKVPMVKSTPPPMNNRSGEILISFRVPRVRLETIFLSEEAKDSITRALAEQTHALTLAQAGLTPKNRFLFWGPPGCGKSATAEALASELGWTFGVVRLSSLISSFVGETASNLQKIFNFANEYQAVLLFDEADAVAKNREDRNDVGELKRVVNTLLQCLDQLSPRNSIAILASNHQHLLDRAVWRRFDDVVEFPLPSRELRLALLKHLTSGLRLKGQLPQVADLTKGASFAEIERGVMEIAKTVILSKRDYVNALEISDAIQKWRQKEKAANLPRRPRKE